MTTDGSREVEVAVTAEEIEAEVIRSRLEADRIPARIAAKSQIGVPASWSPRGLGYGIGSFSVRVPSEYARQAREILADTAHEPGPPGAIASLRPLKPKARLVVRLIATVVLLYLLIGMAYWLTQILPELF